MRERCSTPFLVLRKTPFGETSLVLAGISPELGQAHFLARGVCRTGRKQFPVADLFRCLTVQYRVGKGDLLTWCGAELEQDFGGVAKTRAGYATACWLARFALANTPEALPQPRFFQALTLAFSKLAALPTDRGQEEEERFRAGMGPLLTYLAEHGLLPGLDELPAPVPWLEAVLAVEPGVSPSELPPDDRQRLRNWVLRRLREAECRLGN